MWTLTKDGWRDTGEEEIQSLHSIVDSLQCQNLNRLRGSILCQGIKSVYIYTAVHEISAKVLHKHLLHHQVMRFGAYW